MRTLNTTTLDNMEKFIIDYQKRKGKSPSFREVMKALNMSSLNLVRTYILALENSGRIERTRLGNIDMLPKLRPSGVAITPIVGSIACGQPVDAVEQIEESVTLPRAIFGGGDLFILHTHGDSMIDIGIKHGDLVVIRKQNSAENGDIKDPNDKNKWLIDEEAATVVRRIFGLCMQGFGPTQISRILTDEGVDTPKIHAKKMGRKVTIRANEMPEAWADQTVGAILGYWEYLGWTVNFKTKKKSFKSKKVILLPSDEWQIFKDTQEPIIDEETFWAVQKIREGKRRLDSLGEPNALSGMLFCGDCGHRLYLRRQRDPHQKDYFVCSVYRKKRKYFCTSHFIRLADIEKILLRDLRQVTAFAREHESEFLDLAKKRSLRETEKLRAENKASLDKAVRRIAEIDGIIQKLYEDNVSGKISDERFAKMTATYEAEQNGLQQTAQRLKEEISVVREEGESVDRFMKLVNKYSDITELNAEIIRTFVEKIIVYEAEKIDGIKTQRVKIVYNCVGTVSVPNADNEPVKTDKTKIIEVA